MGSVAGVYSGSPPESGRPAAISFAAGAAGPNYLFGFGPKRGKYAGRQFHDDFKGNIGAKPLAGASVKNKKKKRDIPFLLFVSCSVGVFWHRPPWLALWLFRGICRGQTSSTKPFPFAFADKLEETLFPGCGSASGLSWDQGAGGIVCGTGCQQTVPNDMVKKRKRFFAVSECGCNGKD